MLELQATWLVSELLTIDRLSTGAVMVCEITTLSHEAVDDSVKMGVLVSVSHLVVSSTDRSEILSSNWNMVFIELKNNLANWSGVLGDLEENLGVLG